MSFASPVFLFIFIPCFFLAYFLVANKHKNYVGLLASCFFYTWGEPKFIVVLIASIIVDWYLAKLIYRYRKEKKIKTAILFVSVLLNVSVLVCFKYANFLVDNINFLLSYANAGSIQLGKIALPIGVSFVVFEKITYVVDIYRKEVKTAETIIHYAFYVLLFPKLLAGPIIKYHDIESQLKKRTINYEDVWYGFYRFSFGLAKKILIADSLAGISDLAFGTKVLLLSSSDAWIGIICFMLQIYFDFSGYSDMAIGLGRIMGFKIMENFNTPYMSYSFTEFWRRWHISFTSWMRNYLYIPLGGNRRSKCRTYFNLLLVFFISGLWHGANWTFVVWGLYHGFFLILERSFLLKKLNSVPKIFGLVYTLFFVLIGWVVFRSESIGQAISYLHRMFFYTPNQYSHLSMNMAGSTWTVLILGVCICLLPLYTNALEKCKVRLSVYIPKIRLCMPVFLLFLCMCRVASKSFNPFIYFRF